MKWIKKKFRILQHEHLKKFDIVTKFPTAFTKHEMGAGDGPEGDDDYQGLKFYIFLKNLLFFTSLSF